MPAINDPVDFYFSLTSGSTIKPLFNEKEKLNPGEIGQTSYYIIISTRFGNVKLSSSGGINPTVEYKIPEPIQAFKSLLPIDPSYISLNEMLKFTGYNLELIKINPNIGEQIEELFK